MNIEDRYFADGGLEHNNPSFAIYFHYTSDERKKSTKPRRSAAPHFSPHGDLDCSCVRFVNIGTGARPDEVVQGKRDRLAGLVPGTIRRAVFLKETLTEIAVNSEEKVEIMRQFESLKPEVFKYERFDANHGVSNIKLDRYDALSEIRQKTEGYLDEQDTKDLLEEVGEAIARDYLGVHSIHDQNNASASSVANQSDPRLLDVPSLLPASSSTSTTQSVSIDPPPNTKPRVLLSKEVDAATNDAAEIFLSPSQPEHYAHEVSGIRIIE